MRLFIAGCLSKFPGARAFRFRVQGRAPSRLRVRFPASLTTERKSGEDYGRLRIFFGRLRFTGERSEDVNWLAVIAIEAGMDAARVISLLQRAIERAIRRGKEIVKFDQPGGRGNLGRTGGPLPVQRLGTLQPVAAVCRALESDEKAAASV